MAQFTGYGKKLFLRNNQTEYQLSSQEVSATWNEIHRQLSDAERDFIISFIVREGILNLLKRLDYPNISGHIKFFIRELVSRSSGAILPKDMDLQYIGNNKLLTL